MKTGKKVCRLCGKEKDISQFYKHKSNKDHKTGECIDCRKKMSKEYYKDHKDQIIARDKEYRKMKNFFK